MEKNEDFWKNNRLIDGGKEESFAGRLFRAEDTGDKAAFSIRQDWTDTGENAEWEEAKAQGDSTAS